MDLGLAGQVAVVTGASRGIGAAIASGLAAEGARLVLCARGAEGLAQQAVRLGERGADAHTVALDLTEPGAAERLIGETLARFGQLDVLVHNLGGRQVGDTDDAWRFTLDINLGVAVRLSRAAVPHMKARRRGVILLITSVSGWQVGGAVPSYNAAKAAEIMFARSLARELAPFGIRANAVSPGSILFPGGGWDARQRREPERIAQFVSQHLPLGRFGTPEEVAHVVVFLASERASLVTGAHVTVDGCQLHPSI